MFKGDPGGSPTDKSHLMKFDVKFAVKGTENERNLRQIHEPKPQGKINENPLWEREIVGFLAYNMRNVVDFPHIKK